MTNVIERTKDGMREAARLYGWVENVYGTIEHIDTQVMEGLAGNVFPFPVFYAIRTAPEKDKFKVLRFFLEKDLTEGTASRYLKCINDPKNGWRKSEHIHQIVDLMTNAQSI